MSRGVLSPICDSDHWWKLQSCCSPVQFSGYLFTGAAFSISLSLSVYCHRLYSTPLLGLITPHSGMGLSTLLSSLAWLTGWLSSAPARPAQSLPTLARAAGLCPAWPGELDLAPGAATNTAKFRHIIWRLSVMRTALILGKCQVNMDSSLSSAELMSVKNVSSMSNTWEAVCGSVIAVSARFWACTCYSVRCPVPGARQYNRQIDSLWLVVTVKYWPLIGQGDRVTTARAPTESETICCFTPSS